MKNQLNSTTGSSVYTTDLGIDVGNGYTKSTKAMFCNRIERGRFLDSTYKKKNQHEVIYNGVEYIIGKGELFDGDRRHFTKEYEMALLTAIVLNCPNDARHIISTVCIGLPVKIYNSKTDPYKSDVEQHYTGFTEKITVNSKEYTITITNCTVMQEGACVVYYMNPRRCLVIDMGSGTLNASEFINYSCTRNETYSKGMTPLISQHYSSISDKYPLINHDREDLENNFDKDAIKLGGKSYDITFLKNITQDYISSIIATLKRDFPYLYSYNEIYVVGGGGKKTRKYWESSFNPGVVIVPNDGQYVNQKLLDKVAKLKAANHE